MVTTSTTMSRISHYASGSDEIERRCLDHVVVCALTSSAHRKALQSARCRLLYRRRLRLSWQRLRSRAPPKHALRLECSPDGVATAGAFADVRARSVEVRRATRKRRRAEPIDGAAEAGRAAIRLVAARPTSSVATESEAACPSLRRTRLCPACSSLGTGRCRRRSPSRDPLARFPGGGRRGSWCRPVTSSG